MVDAHWHPTKISARINLLELTAKIGRLPSERDIPVVRVVGGCFVYVDGPSYKFPETLLGDRSWPASDQSIRVTTQVRSLSPWLRSVPTVDGWWRK